jgi:hypothetical protein
MKASVCFILLSLYAFNVLGKEHKVKKVIVTDIAYQKNKHGRTKKLKQLSHYIIYDGSGREIEYGNYGQSSCNTFIKSDSGGIKSIFVGSSHNYTKIGIVDFTAYNHDGKIENIETWSYFNNKKHLLMDSVQYLYQQNMLLRMISYDDSGNIEKIASYSYDSIGNKTAVIDSQFDRYSNKFSIDSSIYRYTKTNKLLDIKIISDCKVLRREQFIYDKNGDSPVTIFSYYDNDSIPDLIISDYYHLSCKYPYGNVLTEEYEQRTGSSSHTDAIYHYNKYGFRKKIEQYEGAVLKSAQVFKYRYYRD